MTKTKKVPFQFKNELKICSDRPLLGSVDINGLLAALIEKLNPFVFVYVVSILTEFKSFILFGSVRFNKFTL